jgi:calcium/calmodulin-dependent 3',5'-cyclic nucleotide phosphodiesterase
MKQNTPHQNHLNLNGQLDILHSTRNRRNSRMISNSTQDDRIIEEVRLTSFEKVIKILQNIRALLQNYKANDAVLADLDWVVQKIYSRDLYNFEICDPSKLENFTKESSDYFLNILSSYSNNKEEFTKIAKENYNNFSEKNLVISRNEKTLLKNSTIMKTDEKAKLNKLLAMNKSKINELQAANTVSFQKLKTLFINETKLDRDSIKDAFTVGFEEEIEINIESKDFNIFNFTEKLDRKRVLPTIYNEVLTALKMQDTHKLNLEKLDKFSHEIQHGYNKNVLYHNDLHASDLCQTLFCWINRASIKKHLNLSTLDLFALYTSAILHDFKHPGLTNAFHLNNLTELALAYNDKSVLENMHISESFKILMRPECNFIENFSLQEFKELRRIMIECVLATDMVHHSKIISQLKSKATVLEINNGNNIEKLLDRNSKTFFEDRQEILNLLIHLGDLSHNSKSFEISKTWTYLLYEEFYKQGDHERSLNSSISMFCDRYNSNIPKSQIGFIRGIVIPSFDVLINFFPQLDYTIENLEDNVEYWTEMLEKEK